MLERDIEAYLVRKIKAAGGCAYKFTSPQRRGVPDRLVILPEGNLCFVEVKTEKGVVSPLQNIEINRLRSFGVAVYVVRSKEEIDTLLTIIME